MSSITEIICFGITFYQTEAPNGEKVWVYKKNGILYSAKDLRYRPRNRIAKGLLSVMLPSETNGELKPLVF